DRAAYLLANDGGDAELRAAVQRLLVAHEQPAPVLVSSASGVPNDAAPLPAAPSPLPLSPEGRGEPAAPLSPAAGARGRGEGDGQTGPADHADPTARVGALLAGKYKLIEEIGEGGMGSVFMAQQTAPVKRAVAVKVIKAGMDSKAVLARFEAERQALA